MDDYENLKAICDEIDVLISKEVTATSNEFMMWKNKASRFLAKKYGDSSYELCEFCKIKFDLDSSDNSAVLNYLFSGRLQVEKCQRSLLFVRSVFETYLKEMKNEMCDEDIQLQSNQYSKVFIVHGHNGELREAVARLVEKQGIQAIILNERINHGTTIIQKLEKYGDVEAAICLFTADDIGKAKSEPNDKKRARQNVVFEAGYFIGKLGRDNVVIVSEKGIEIPSDMEGIVYTDTDYWKLDILRELKAIGYNIDLNKLMN